MKYFGLISLMIVILIGAWWEIKSYEKSKPAKEEANQTQAVAMAQATYYQKKSAGMNFSNGPCLSEEIMPGWSVDIVHNPRTAIDDLSQNQCQYYRSGKTKHFIELDTNGNLIRAQ